MYDKISDCEIRIRNFVVIAERLYGIENVGFNMPVLTHLGHCYRKNGSLSDPQIRLGDDRNGVLETRLWPSISDKMEGQHRAFQF